MHRSKRGWIRIEDQDPCTNAGFAQHHAFTGVATVAVYVLGFEKPTQQRGRFHTQAPDHGDDTFRPSMSLQCPEVVHDSAGVEGQVVTCLAVRVPVTGCNVDESLGHWRSPNLRFRGQLLWPRTRGIEFSTPESAFHRYAVMACSHQDPMREPKSGIGDVVARSFLRSLHRSKSVNPLRGTSPLALVTQRRAASSHQAMQRTKSWLQSSWINTPPQLGAGASTTVQTIRSTHPCSHPLLREQHRDAGRPKRQCMRFDGSRV